MCNQFVCPNCGSENIKKAHLIYEEGHSTGTTTSSEIIGYRVPKGENASTYSNPSDAIYGSVTRPINTTSDLARRFAPPQKPELKSIKGPDGPILNGIFYILGNSFYILPILYFIRYFFSIPISHSSVFLLDFVLLLSLFVWTEYEDNKTEAELKAQYEAEMVEWNKQMSNWRLIYVCLRCGNSFYL